MQNNQICHCKKHNQVSSYMNSFDKTEEESYQTIYLIESIEILIMLARKKR